MRAVRVHHAHALTYHVVQGFGVQLALLPDTEGGHCHERLYACRHRLGQHILHVVEPGPFVEVVDVGANSLVDPVLAIARHIYAHRAAAEERKHLIPHKLPIFSSVESVRQRESAPATYARPDP